VFLKQDKLAEALEHLSAAVAAIRSSGNRGVGGGGGGGVKFLGKGCGEEVFSNYATALRRSKRYDEALVWYQECLAESPNDAGTHANIAFTLHLSRKFDEAISSYHKALALQPTFTFCSEMLSTCMIDCDLFSTSNYNARGEDSLPEHLRIPEDDVDASFNMSASSASTSFSRIEGHLDLSLSNSL